MKAHPDEPQALLLIGVASHRIRRDSHALGWLQRAAALQPKSAAAHHALGVVLQEHGRYDEAITAQLRAIGCSPEMVEAHQSLGAALLRRGEYGRALAAFRRAAELAPRSAAVATALVAALRNTGRGRDAVEVARSLVERCPEAAEAHRLLAMELHREGLLRAAVASHSRAIELDPRSAAGFTDLGVTLHAIGDLQGAAKNYSRALAIDGKNVRAHHNFALACSELNLLDDALASYGAALALDPRNADLHWDHALALLRAGRLREGWTEFEWRWRAPSFPGTERHMDHPRWDGSALSGRRLLAYAEQGLGDTIQFSRYLPMLPRGQGGLLLECPPELIRLMRSLEGVDEVVERGRSSEEFDLQVPLMSLPRLFGTAAGSIPDAVPYLFPDQQYRERWKQELNSAGPLLVGLVWSGSSTHRNDDNRSIPAEALAPLFRVGGVRWIGLQVGARGMPPGLTTNLGPRFSDLAETAAALMNLDLVVSVDTAVAHLAGAIGMPVWTLLPHAPDWRWMQEREDSPWYPTMRLFRQPSRGDWGSVVERVAAELAKLETSLRPPP